MTSGSETSENMWTWSGNYFRYLYFV